ncbi:MAG: histidine kinase dimerization/phospho-acceptor domain-containing protein [Kofleriaceae bacterium]
MIGGRTFAVAALTTGAIAIVLIGWYRAGVREVDGQVDAMVNQAEREAHDREVALAAALTGRLEALRVAESARPYLHYQNLFHDPAGASDGLSVTPSPLAQGPADPLVAVHFQIDEADRVSSPSINDEVPEAVQAMAPDRDALARLADVRDALARRAAQVAVAIPTPPVRVALAQVARPRQRPASKAGPLDLDAADAARGNLAAQTVELAPEAYAQNQMSNQIFAQQRRGPVPRQPVATAPGALPEPGRAGATAPVVITVAPLTWTAVELAGEPALVAVRQVLTPAGARTQGLLVTGATVRAWLAALPDPGGALATTGGTELGIAASPWSLRVDAADDVAYARGLTSALHDSFLMKFVPVAVIAVLCGLLVVGVTARGEQLARERVRFAAAAAHELRTPLAGIQLYGDMLAEELGDPTRQRDYAQQIAAEAARLGRVVGNVMGVTQLERGGLTARLDAGDVVEVVREVMVRAEPALLRAGATLELIAPPSAWARLDRDAVARILGNLIDNAEKYARAAADRTITISVATTATAVELAVRDRGPGLPSALRRGRFRAFVRGRDPDAPPGLGLGLALSQALAAAMGATLTTRDGAPGAEVVLRLQRGAAPGPVMGQR